MKRELIGASLAKKEKKKEVSPFEKSYRSFQPAGNGQQLSLLPAVVNPKYKIDLAVKIALGDFGIRPVKDDTCLASTGELDGVMKFTAIPDKKEDFCDRVKEVFGVDISDRVIELRQVECFACLMGNNKCWDPSQCKNPL